MLYLFMIAPHTMVEVSCGWETQHKGVDGFTHSADKLQH